MESFALICKHIYPVPLVFRLFRLEASVSIGGRPLAHAAEAQERGEEVGVHVAIELVLRDTNSRDSAEPL